MNDFGLSTNRLIMKIQKRAEKMEPGMTAASFAPLSGFLEYLHSREDQVILGRRGTGKTHALLYLEQQVRSVGDLPIYIDMRQLGSSGGTYGDTRFTVSDRGTQILADMLEVIHRALLALAVEADTTGTPLDFLLEHLDPFIDAASHVEVVGQVEQEYSNSTSSSHEDSADGSVSVRNLNITGKASTRRKRDQSSASKSKVSGTQRPHIVFSALGAAWKSIDKALESRAVWIMLDEWSSIPADLQPIVADLIRRTVLPLRNVVIKISGVENFSNFMHKYDDQSYLGIELGTDIPSVISLDELLSQHANESSVEFIQSVMLHHINSLLSEYDYSPIRSEEFDRNNLVRIFDSEDSLKVLLHCFDGIPRETLLILADAAMQAGDRKIGKREIRLAAKNLYLTTKKRELRSDPPAKQLLAQILKEIIVRRGVRVFTLQQDEDSEDQRVTSLYNSRILHCYQRGILDAMDSDSLYDVYAIDYGCFASRVSETVAQRDEPSEQVEVDCATVVTGDLRSLRFRIPRVAGSRRL